MNFEELLPVLSVVIFVVIFFAAVQITTELKRISAELREIKAQLRVLLEKLDSQFAKRKF